MISYRESKDVVIVTTESAQLGKGSSVQLYIRSKNRTNTTVECQGVTYVIPSEGITPRLDGDAKVIKDALETELYIERTIWTLSGEIDSDESYVFAKTDAGGSIFSVPAKPPVWRGIGQAMSWAIQGLAAGANWSSTCRSRHYSNVRFRRVRAVLQTAWPQGNNPIVDTNFADDYNFQVGFELGYKEATTGIAPRKMFRFSNSTVATYLASAAPSTGYILSDVLDIGRFVEAKEFFGLWTTVENIAHAANKMPYQRNGTNFLQKYVGIVSSATSNIDNNVAETATSVSPSTSTQGGHSHYFTPVMLLIETDSDLPFVVHLSDSIGWGVGEGVAGSGTEGDALGSALGNCGFIDRALYETLGYSSVNLGKGSDGNKYLITPDNWKYRRQLMVLANPTHVINANVHNDMPIGTLANWAASTAYNKYDIAVSSVTQNQYLATKPGTSSTVQPAQLAGAKLDGTVVWEFLQLLPLAAAARPSGYKAAFMANVNAQVKDVLPNVDIIIMALTPDASSTDSWATAANQTPTTTSGWGDVTSRRHYVNALFKNLYGPLGAKACFDPSIYLEEGYPSETSKWISNGSASYVTNDGAHPNSVGYKLGAASITADLFTS